MPWLSLTLMAGFVLVVASGDSPTEPPGYSDHRRAQANEIRAKSEVTFRLERLFFWLKKHSPAWTLNYRNLDLYLAAWLAVFLLLASWANRTLPALALDQQYLIFGASTYRLFDISQSVINIGVFDRLGFDGPQRVANTTRSIVLLVWSFVEVSLWFGLLDLLLVIKHATSLGDALYFSMVTQLTIGYGDLVPVGPARLVAVLHGLLGWFITVVVFAQIVSLRSPDSQAPESR